MYIPCKNREVRQGKDEIYTINVSAYTWRLMYRMIRIFKTKKKN